MEKRDMENPTKFSLQIKNECEMYDLQGLCKNRNNEYTIAVEAIDMGNDPVEAYVEIFSEDEIYAKTCFAQRLGAYFVLMLHKKEQQGDKIYLKSFKENQNTNTVECFEEKKLSDAYFINWWKARKTGMQSKEYRGEMQRKILASYFDQLLEKNQTSWTGNIDGFFIEKDASGKGKVSGIVECRFSTSESIMSYDPNKYFKYGGGDYVTWNSLLELAHKMNVPLYLFTYSRLWGHRDKVGATEVVGMDKERGLIYKNGLRPCDSVFGSGAEVKEWINNR